MNNLEVFSREQLADYQKKELKKLLHYLDGFSIFYKNHFRLYGIDINQIHDVNDLVRIPTVSKEDLQKHNWDFLCVKKNAIVEYCTTSGTLGNPVTIGLTERDLQRLAKNELESFLCAEVTPDDIILLMLSLDRMFMAGIAYYSGARALGAGIIRGGPGNFAMQLETIQRMKPTVLVAVPSFLAGMVAYAHEQNIDLNKSSVRKIICIGENIRNEDFSLNALGQRIRKHWKVELFSTYASTEQQTAFTECPHGKGGHHNAELMIFEVLDDDGNPLPQGTIGELVITTLRVEGMPLLRYRTGDLCTYYESTCECGRITSRISPIFGRKHQLIKYKGTTIYPQTVFNILNSMEGVQDYVISLYKNDLGTDEFQIYLALNPKFELKEDLIKQSLQSSLRVLPPIQYKSLQEVQKMQVVEGKRKIHKLIDIR